MESYKARLSELLITIFNGLTTYDEVTAYKNKLISEGKNTNLNVHDYYTNLNKIAVKTSLDKVKENINLELNEWFSNLDLEGTKEKVNNRMNSGKNAIVNIISKASKLNINFNDYSANIQVGINLFHLYFGHPKMDMSGVSIPVIPTGCSSYRIYKDVNGNSLRLLAHTDVVIYPLLGPLKGKMLNDYLSLGKEDRICFLLMLITYCYNSIIDKTTFLKSVNPLVEYVKAFFPLYDKCAINGGYTIEELNKFKTDNVYNDKIYVNHPGSNTVKLIGFSNPGCMLIQDTSLSTAVYSAFQNIKSGIASLNTKLENPFIGII